MDSDKVRARGNIRGQLTRIRNFLQTVGPETSIFTIDARHKTFLGLYEKFDKVQTELESDMDVKNLGKEDELRGKFEEEFFETEAIFLELFMRLDRDMSSTRGPVNELNNAVRLNETVPNQPNIAFKLPQVSLPTFGGEITEWSSFIELFNSLIHSNETLSNINKLFYLKSCLKGDALRIIESIPTTGENYVRARELLTERYDNKWCIIQAHLSVLLQQPQIKNMSVNALRQLIDVTNKHLAILDSLDEPVEHWDSILVFTLSNKLDLDTKRQFEFQFASVGKPTFKNLIDFLKQRCLGFERVETTKGKSVKSFSAVSEGSKQSSRFVECCSLCKGEHRLFKCPKFLNLDPCARYDHCKKCGICVNCLSGNNHVAKMCKSRGCLKCEKRHNTLLHFEKRNPEPLNANPVNLNVDPLPPNHNETIGSVSTVGLQSTNFQPQQILLYTALVRVRNERGELVVCRSLIDSGSQSCFISEACADRLRLTPKLIDMSVNGIGNASTVIKRYVDFEIHSMCEKFSLPIQALVLPKITMELPQTEINSTNMDNMFSNLKLADPNCFVPGKIDVLLSNEVFTRILRGNILNSKQGCLKAVDTNLGWLIGGSVQCATSSLISTTSLMATHDLKDIGFDLSKFWELEEVPVAQSHLKDPCEIHFHKTYQRDLDGKFVIELPFTTDRIDFSHSKAFALSRFHFLEKRLNNNSKLRRMYFDFMDEYLKLDFVEFVPLEEYENLNSYYLPHHGVLKESSQTTKLRAVFDGTAAPAGRQSLNSVLFAGEKLHNDLFKILLKFRSYKIAVIADVEKMFCQVKMNRIHKDFVRFFWRPKENEAIKIMRLKVLPFGLRCSPFVAMSCLRELGKTLQGSYPRACNFVLENFYVDDFIAGASSVEDALALINDVSLVCESGGFKLRKWVSNSEQVLEGIQRNLIAEPHTFSLSGECSKVLGLFWCPGTDTFGFVSTNVEKEVVTKRSILSHLAQLFDPFGWLGPVIVKGKILLQELWLLKIDWDAAVPTDIENDWLKLKNNLKMIKEIKVERYIGYGDGIILCGFSDASIKAYGACVYCVADGKSTLVAAKSRVAPLKSVSLARLELCGAVLGARLMQIIANVLGVPLSSCFMWCDSTIVLAWLAKPSYSWKTFVANRVAEVHTLLPNVLWSHVRSADNPADIISRGVFPSELLGNGLWWHGPNLIVNFDFSRRQNGFFETNKEIRIVNNACLSCVVENLCSRISSYTKLIRVNAWVIRFCDNARKPVEKRCSGNLSINEMHASSVTLISLIQTECFDSAMACLKKNKPLKSSDRLVSLNPFFDNDGLLRVGGRLSNGTMTFNVKYPIILPSKNKFVNLLIRFEHCRNNHIGPNGLMAILRQRFWIINARTTIKSVIAKCYVCCRFSPRRGDQLMGALPRERTEIVRPFFNTGVDLCGPFLVRPTKKRGNSTQKCYVALFICFATKAVHLEVVFDLSTETFIAALKRFVSRRGIPAKLFSDNATNFVGSKNYLSEWYQIINSEAFTEKMYAELLNEQIEWKFIPARSPNFGGLWESHIKSMKTCLLKSMGQSRLTFEEFLTLVIQVEATLNSRPLGAVSSASDELDILTPGHFLIGANLKSLPSQREDEFSGSTGSRWKHLEQIFAHYWKRWSNEYLNTLNQRAKSRKVQENIQIGDLGLLVNENLPPYIWPLCKVIETIKGSDGLVRVVKVKMGNAIFKRGINKFCRLPNFT